MDEYEAYVNHFISLRIEALRKRSLIRHKKVVLIAKQPRLNQSYLLFEMICIEQILTISFTLDG